MSYTIICEDKAIYKSNDDTLNKLEEGNLELALNEAGSFTFTVPPGNDFIDSITDMKSEVKVKNDNDVIYIGRITGHSSDFYNSVTFNSEGILTYLNDSIQRPAEYHDETVISFITKLLDNHNSQVEASKRIQPGIITVTDPNDKLYRYTNWETTLTCLKEKLLKQYGGYFKIRESGGVRYLDYTPEPGDTVSEQNSIEFGKNLLDMAKNYDKSDICTVLIPLGAKKDTSSIQALDERLTISDVNNGNDYLVNEDAANIYGKICKTVTWDDVTTADALLRKGKAWLAGAQYDNLVLTGKAIDMHFTNDMIERLDIGSKVHVISKPHGVDRYFTISKLSYNLLDVSDTEVTLGEKVNNDLSAKVSSAAADISKTDAVSITRASAYSQALDVVTQELNRDADKGHMVYDKHVLLAMDTESADTAQKILRVNVAGISGSSDGGKTYNVAITTDGWIVGSRIAGQSIDAEKFTAGAARKAFAADDNDVTIDTGKITFKGNSIVIDTDNFKINEDGSITIYADIRTPVKDGETKLYSQMRDNIFTIGASFPHKYDDGTTKQWFHDLCNISVMHSQYTDNNYWPELSMNAAPDGDVNKAYGFVFISPDGFYFNNKKTGNFIDLRDGTMNAGGKYHLVKDNNTGWYVIECDLG